MKSAATLLLSLFLGFSAAAKAADSRPNIIFILVDDLRCEAMGFTG